MRIPRLFHSEPRKAGFCDRSLIPTLMTSRSAAIILSLLPAAGGAADPSPVSPVKPESSKHTNRLSREKSPYLLQHQHNPVDWYPWGEEPSRRRERKTNRSC